MKAKLIKIDTNGENFNKFVNNTELYDIITPNILFLVDDCGVIFMANEIDWNKTRLWFVPECNGHCVWTNDGYIASHSLEYIGLNIIDESYADTLSELCDDIANERNILSWINNRYLRDELQSIVPRSDQNQLGD